MKLIVIIKQYSALIIEMERPLVLWLEDQYQQCMKINLSKNQKKAKGLSHWKGKSKGSESEEFLASTGWCMQFKNQKYYQNFKVQGEASIANDKTASYNN